MSSKKHKAMMANMRGKGKIIYSDILGHKHNAKEKSFVTQTILFDQDYFSPEDARKWLKGHGKVAELDIKKELKSGEKPVIRARQVSPKLFESLHTKPIEKGVEIVGGRIAKEKL